MGLRTRWRGEGGEFRFECVQFDFEAGLAIPDECHVQEYRGENRAVGGEQESEVIHHQSLCAPLRHLWRETPPSRSRVRPRRFSCADAAP
jgi:hypothetical protein